MGKSKVLVKVHPEGKYVVDLDKSIDIGKLTPGEQQQGGWGLGV
jgi:26S proteasome regulatory subunit T6